MDKDILYFILLLEMCCFKNPVPSQYSSVSGKCVVGLLLCSCCGSGTGVEQKCEDDKVQEPGHWDSRIATGG